MGKTLADSFDSYVNWIVGFLFLSALNLAFEASTFLVNEAMGEGLEAFARWLARGSSVCLAIAMILWVRLIRRKQLRLEHRNFLDEFVTSAIQRSAMVAFLITLCLVAILDVVTNNSQLPADFYIKLPSFSLTAGFSISYYIFNRIGQNYSSDDLEQE